MAISDTITSMYENVGNVYDVLELAGADLTNVDKNIENLKQTWEERLKYYLANGLDVVWNNWEKVSGSGETITLNNTIEAKMDFVYKGNTSQTGTPTPDNPIPVQVVSGDNTIKVEGKNLVNYDNNTNLENKYLNASGSFESAIYTYVNGTIKANSNKITISFNNSVGQGYVRIGEYKEDGTFIKRTLVSTTPTTLTLDSNTSYLIYSIDKNSDNYFEKLQLELGNQATTYTPYVSQTYPINLGNIELCKIGDYQDKITKSTGKNLFDVSTITENTYIDENGNTGTSSVTNLSDYIEVKSNTSYTLSYDYSALLNSNQRNVCYYNENETFISSDVYIPTDKTHAITTPNNAKYLRFSYDKNCYSIMLNEGTTALPYEPYGKVWYLNKQIGKVVLDGSEFWDKIDNSTPDYIYVASTAIDNIAGYGTFLEYSNYFSQPTRKITPSYVTDKPVISGTDSNEGVRIRILVPTSTADSLNNFKIWLSTHNTTVYYVLATPTYEEITDSTLISQLEAIKKSYNTQTNISQTNADKPFILDVTALGN